MMSKQEQAAALLSAITASLSKGYAFKSLDGTPLLTIDAILKELIDNKEITVIEPSGIVPIGYWQNGR